MKKIIIIGIIVAAIAIGSVGYFSYASSSNNPWYGMSCEEMINLAMSPDHHSFTEQQHMQFHMELEPCLQNMKNTHP